MSDPPVYQSQTVPLQHPPQRRRFARFGRGMSIACLAIGGIGILVGVILVIVGAVYLHNGMSNVMDETRRNINKETDGFLNDVLPRETDKVMLGGVLVGIGILVIIIFITPAICGFCGVFIGEAVERGGATQPGQIIIVQDPAAVPLQPQEVKA